MDASSYIRMVRSDECRASRTLLIALLSLLFFQLCIADWADYFALVPGKAASMHHNLWTFVTAGFYEVSTTMGVVNLAVIAVVGPPVERVMTTPVFVRFMLLVNVAVFFCTFMFMVFCYAVTEMEMFLYSRVCGASWLSASLGMAIKQRWGDRPLIQGIPQLRIGHLPSLVCILAIVLWFVGRLGGKESPLVVFGTFWSWFYLRFYAVDADTRMVGDLRDEFAFATLLPDIFGIRPIVTLISTMLFQTLVNLGMFQDAVRTRGGGGGGRNNTQSSHSQASSMSSSSSNDIELGVASTDHTFAFRAVDPNAERRRALAIRAINEKLAELARDSGNTNSNANNGGNGNDNMNTDNPSQGMNGNGDTHATTLSSLPPLPPIESFDAPTASTN